jgi:hypothetical protein
MDGKDRVTVTRAGYISAPKAAKGDTGSVWENVQSIDQLLLISYLQLSLLQENNAMTVGAFYPIPIKNLKKC